VALEAVVRPLDQEHQVKEMLVVQVSRLMAYQLVAAVLAQWVEVIHLEKMAMVEQGRYQQLLDQDNFMLVVVAAGHKVVMVTILVVLAAVAVVAVVEMQEVLQQKVALLILAAVAVALHIQKLQPQEQAVQES
jgi:hypothetical protein